MAVSRKGAPIIQLKGLNTRLWYTMYLVVILAMLLRKSSYQYKGADMVEKVDKLDSLIKLELKSLPLDQKLSRSIYDGEGNLLLVHGINLQKRHIEQLLKKGHIEVYIQEEDSPEGNSPVEEEAISQVSLSPKMETAVHQVKHFMLRAAIGRGIIRSQVEETFDLIYPEIMNTTNILKQIKLLDQKDEYTLKHSVSVAVVAVKIGQILGIPEGPLRSLGIAALLHDIGKAKLPKDLLNKPGKLGLAESRELQKHPLYGFRITEEMRIFDTGVLTAILQHHERCDGSGYPFQLKGPKLHIFSRIIAVADVFDDLISNRPGHQAMSILDALNEIVNHSVGQLDPVISRRLAAYVLDVFPREIVKLNDGSMASVVLVNRDEPDRPMVRMGDYFVNLKEERRWHVIDIA